jgi:hypothetical protein
MKLSLELLLWLKTANKLTVMTLLQKLDQDFFTKGIDTMISCWVKCLNRAKDYIQK